MAQLTGPIFLAAGSSPASPRIKHGYFSSTELDDALGSATSVYVNGVDKPPTQGVIWSIPAHPHVDEGENLYIGIAAAESGKTFDSDDANNAYNINVARYKKSTGQYLGSKLFSRVGQRNSTTATGGVADDLAVNQDVDTIIAAFGPVPADEFWTIYGATRIKLDDTA